MICLHGPRWPWSFGSSQAPECGQGGRDLGWDLPGTPLCALLVSRPKDIPRRGSPAQHTATHLCLTRNRAILPRDRQAGRSATRMGTDAEEHVGPGSEKRYPCRALSRLYKDPQPAQPAAEGEQRTSARCVLPTCLPVTVNHVSPM